MASIVRNGCDRDEKSRSKTHSDTKRLIDVVTDSCIDERIFRVEIKLLDGEIWSLLTFHVINESANKKKTIIILKLIVMK